MAGGMGADLGFWGLLGERRQRQRPPLGAGLWGLSSLGMADPPSSLWVLG